MRTYSILCETCGDILEDGSPGTTAVYAVTHGDECPGPTATYAATLSTVYPGDNHEKSHEQADKQRGVDKAVYELSEVIRLTVEYVGNDTLPPINGWSWFDALRTYRPELAEHFEQNPQLRPDNHVTREIIADQIQDRADLLEGDDV